MLATIVLMVMLSLSIVIGSILIGNSIRKASEDNNRNQSSYSETINKALMTEKEAAEYLNLSLEVFNSLLSSEELERKRLGTYPTYGFIPFVKIGDVKYFNKDLLDKWVEYSVTNRKEIIIFTK